MGLSVASCLPRRQGTSALSSTSSSGKVRNCVARCKQARASAHVKHKTEQAVPNCCTPRSTNAAKGKLSGSKFSSNQVEANSRPIHVSHKFKYPAPPPPPLLFLSDYALACSAVLQMNSSCQGSQKDATGGHSRVRRPFELWPSYHDSNLASNSGRGPLFVLEIRGLTDRLNIKQNKVLKYILRFQYCFCCTIIYFDIWCQFIEKILSNHDMVW